MCAMMPMFRVFSSEYCRSTSRPCFLDSVVSARYMRRGGSACGPPLGSALRLPAIVSERLVGLRHLMRVLALLHGGAAVVRGVEQLGGKLLGHPALDTAPRRADDPPHRQRPPSIGTPPYAPPAFGALGPYFERLCFRPATPAVSRVPRMMWYRIPGRSLTRPPRIITIECSWRLWPTPGM